MRPNTTQATLALIENEKEELLLAMKLRGFWNGKWNGPGGKLNPGETPEDACIRETFEEVGVTLEKTKLQALGIIEFSFEENPKWNVDVHVFHITEYNGTAPVKSEEMDPKWFPKTSLPYDAMWAADRVWIPKALEGLPIPREIVFNADGSEILSIQ